MISRIRALLGDGFSRDVLWNIVSLGIAGVAGVVVNYLVGQTYGASALGVFNQVYAIYIVVSQLAALGVHSSVLTYVAATEDMAERRDIVVAALTTTALVAVPMAGVFVLLAVPVAQLLDSPDVGRGMWWAAPGLCCFALNKVILAVLNGARRMRAYAVFQAGRVVFMAIGFGVCLLLRADRHVLPVMLTVGEGLTLLLALPTIADHLGRVELAALRRWAKTHLRFGVRGFLAGLFGELNTRIDVLVLGAFVGDALVGAYSLAALVAEGLFQTLIALRTNYAPVVVRLLAAGDHVELTRVVHKGRRRTYLAALAGGTLAVASYALLIPYVVSDPELQRSWIYFGVLLAGMVASAGYVPFNQLLLWARHPGWHTVMIALVVATSALLCVGLVATFGAIGAACATAITYALSALFLRWIVRRVLRLAI